MTQCAVSFLLACVATPAMGQTPLVPLPRSLFREFDAAKFFDANRGYVFGDAAPTAIIATDDGGANWRLAMDITGFNRPLGEDVSIVQPQELHAVFFLDQDRFWLLERGGTLHYTSDGGRSFTQSVVDYVDETGKREEALCGELYFRSEREGWAACFDPLLHTTDGGVHWESLPLPKDPPEVGYVWMFDAREGIAVGNGLIRTTDGGITWRVIPSPFDGSRSLKKISCTPSGFCAALLWMYGPLLVSNDRGLTWRDTQVPLKPDQQDQIAGVHAFADNGLVAVGTDAGFTYHDLDRYVLSPPPPLGLVLRWNGTAWTRITHAAPSEFSGVHFVDADNGWLLAYQHRIYKTTDGGQTLQLVNDYFRQLAALTPTEAPIVFETPTP